MFQAAFSIRSIFKRELRRISHGHYKKSNRERLWTLGLIVLFASFVLGIVYEFGVFDYQYLHIFTSFQSIILALLVPAILWAVLELSLVFRWVIYWIVLATILMFTIQEDWGTFGKSKQEIGLIVFFSFLILEAATVIVYVCARFVYPRTVLRLSMRDPVKFWDVKPTGKDGQFTCKMLWTSERRQFSYVGDLNDDGQPHGYGKWTSYWPYGEILSGHWENGEPVGPFRSREYRTGFSFENLRIAYISVSDAPNNKTTLKQGKMRFGVVGVECSISGRFFSDLPHVTQILKSDMETSFSYCIDNLLHISQFDNRPKACTSLSIKIVEDTIHIDGFSSLGKRDQLIITKQNNALKIDGFEQNSPEREALFFVPGFNCTVDNSAKLLAQMISLGGGLPAHVKPIVFGWPGGSLIQYFSAKSKTADQHLKQSLMLALRQVVHSGITRIHILSHSMGARLVLEAVPELHEFFKSGDSQSKPTLLSMTFLNPEALLRVFCDAQFNMIRDLTSLISVYGNDKDVALMASQYLFERQPIMGCNTQKFHKSAIALEPHYLDMDVMDTTALDVNIHAARHSYFNLNKFVIDDLIDLLIRKERARERVQRLVHLDNNVYGFLSAPSFIKN